MSAKNEQQAIDPASEKVPYVVIDVSAEKYAESAKVTGGLTYGFAVGWGAPANAGRQEVHLINLPAGTRFASVWVSEQSGQPAQSHVGSAIFYTYSVQLFKNGTMCRIIYELVWPNRHGTVGAGLQYIFG